MNTSVASPAFGDLLLFTFHVYLLICPQFPGQGLCVGHRGRSLAGALAGAPECPSGRDNRALMQQHRARHTPVCSETCQWWVRLGEQGEGSGGGEWRSRGWDIGKVHIDSRQEMHVLSLCYKRTLKN